MGTFCAQAARLIGVSFIVLSALAACAQDPSIGVDPAWTSQVESLTLEAEAGGAKPEQLAALRLAAREGEVTFEAYSDAIAASQACMIDAGLLIDASAVRHLNGIDIIQFGWGGNPSLSETETFGIHDDCLRVNSQWVETLYAIQPSSVEARESLIASFREPMLACLRSHGLEIADDASADEISAGASEVAGVDWEGPNCVVESGLNAALNGETGTNPEE